MERADHNSACRASDVLDSFMTHWMIHWRSYGEVLLSQPLLWRLPYVPCFLHLSRTVLSAAPCNPFHTTVDSRLFKVQNSWIFPWKGTLCRFFHKILKRKFRLESLNTQKERCLTRHWLVFAKPPIKVWPSFSLVRYANTDTLPLCLLIY